jgi:CheY-like chemotaxis protein
MPAQLSSRQADFAPPALPAGAVPDPLPQERPARGLDPQVAAVVHELSNALTIVDLQSKLLELKGCATGPASESLSIIQEQVGRMSRMIDSLRRSMDPLQPVLQPTDVHELLRQTLDLYRDEMAHEGIDIQMRLASPLPSILADRDQLQQVFVNLINNARQAMADSGVGTTLTVETEALRNSAGRVSALTIGFSDNGPGIAPQVLPRIFEPYFTTKQTGTGMGLGLPICQRLVQRHGGQMWAQNNATGGATITILLPVEAAPPAKRERAEHILVIDDEKPLADSLRRLLARAGFRVTVAHDAHEALGVLQGERVDLIVSDLTMPQMDGRQLWQAIHQQNPDLARRMIFSTGDSSRHCYRDFLHKSGCAWLEKPYCEPALLDVIERTLQGDHCLTAPVAPPETE